MVAVARVAAMDVAAMGDVAVENKILVSRGGVACKMLGEISICHRSFGLLFCQAAPIVHQKFSPDSQ